MCDQIYSCAEFIISLQMNYSWSLNEIFFFGKEITPVLILLLLTYTIKLCFIFNLSIFIIYYWYKDCRWKDHVCK